MDTMERRRNAIAALINQNGTVSFSTIKEHFPNVSEMTLRTDLKALDEAKQIVRIHGGAKSVQLVINTDDFFNRRAIRNIQEKQEIAQKALRLIQPDTAIFLDSGSTTTELARLFPDQSNLIYTTGLSCATELAGLEKPVIMLPGGRLNRYSISTYGTTAIQELEQVNFHQTFLGITGYTLQAGFTCGSIEEALLKRTAMKQADQVIVLMDSSKVGMKMSHSICSMADVDLVISDGYLPQDVLAECERHRIPVL